MKKLYITTLLAFFILSATAQEKYQWGKEELNLEIHLTKPQLTSVYQKSEVTVYPKTSTGYTLKYNRYIRFTSSNYLKLGFGLGTEMYTFEVKGFIDDGMEERGTLFYLITPINYAHIWQLSKTKPIALQTSIGMEIAYYDNRNFTSHAKNGSQEYTFESQNNSEFGFGTNVLGISLLKKTKGGRLFSAGIERRFGSEDTPFLGEYYVKNFGSLIEYGRLRSDRDQTTLKLGYLF